MIRLTLILILMFPCLVTAHSGRTNSSGCHNDNKGGTGYHCHNSKPAPTYTPIQPSAVQEPITVTTSPVNYPKPPQNPSVLRGNIPHLESFYSFDRVNLQCIHMGNMFYSADLVYTPTGFSITNLETPQQCQSFSSQYSYLTNILTVFDVDIGAGNYRASLELNNEDNFNLFHLHKHDENIQTTSYNRDDWGTYWGDKDGDCQDTRDEVLKTYNRYQKEESCNLSTGLWIDPYTQFEFYNAGDLDIDHIVPLAYAHKHGGAYWSTELKNNFYNDMENLLPVSASSNRSKGSRSPAEWMPDNLRYHCQYVDSFLYIVDKYHLDIPDTERSNINKQCSQ